MLLWSHSHKSSRTDWVTWLFSAHWFQCPTLIQPWFEWDSFQHQVKHTLMHTLTHTPDFRDTDVLYISSRFKDWLTDSVTEKEKNRNKKNEQNDALIVHLILQYIWCSTFRVWRHKSEIRESDDDGGGDRRRERGKKGWTSDFILKGHRHHLCILWQPAYDSRLSHRISISEMQSNTKSQFSLLRAWKDGERRKWRRRRRRRRGVTEEKENQSGCLLSPPTPRVDLSSLSCPHCTVIFTSIYLNLY